MEGVFSQFLDGLASLGVLDLIRKEPVVFRSAFLRSKVPLTASVFTTQFKINWSQDVFKKEAEEEIFIKFINFLDDVEGL